MQRLLQSAEVCLTRPVISACQYGNSDNTKGEDKSGDLLFKLNNKYMGDVRAFMRMTDGCCRRYGQISHERKCWDSWH